ncbi:MAG: hypothetical protein ACM3H7_05650, partial [Acidobacteriaceae bacterium]
MFKARAYFNEKSPELQQHALPIVEEVCQLDPEYFEAQELLASIRRVNGSENHIIAKGCAQALSPLVAPKSDPNEHLSPWSKYLHEARGALENVRSGDYQQIEKAEHYIHKALVENPNIPLAAVTHLRIIVSNGSVPKSGIRSLAEIYHERWPECLQFLLTLSNEYMESGETNLAVDMLHQAVSKDIAGQVPVRMWGIHHPYMNLWPAKLEAYPTSQNSPQCIPIPAGVASSLGWNQLATGGSGSPEIVASDDQPTQIQTNARKASDASATPAHVPHRYTYPGNAHSLSEATQTAQSELERMADELKRPHVAREDGRFPVYVVFSTRQGLEKHFGPTGFQIIDSELKKMVNLIQGQKINQEYWGAILFYADDGRSTQPYKIRPAANSEPQQLKLSLSELDAALEKKGERIGALLIIGGPEIVPFHSLPNPVEDADNDVPSDNPYASRDGNYFINDWPVGRISGGSTTNLNPLLKVIKEINNRYDSKTTKFAWYYLIIEYVQEFFRRGLYKKQSSYGYTAAVWRRASQSVYRSIGNPDELMVSPPIHACESSEITYTETPALNDNRQNGTSCLLLPEARLGYFNLHGVPDGSEWYGQSDPTIPADGPDFPVAMRPEDIRNSGSAPKLVFSEACYGANIIGKTIDDAISLKFLASGTQAVIGSTCISYGSLASPLTSADLLGHVFWSLVQEGFTVGESFRRAKIHLAREMNQRQGFLDAEDQKTLISFVLFGDPLAQPYRAKINPKVAAHLSDSAVPIATVCEHPTEDESEIQVSLETIKHLKGIVAQYLPGMSDANVRLFQEKQTSPKLCNHCTCGKGCSLSKGNAKESPLIKSQRRVVTLSKSFERAKHTHKQFARL